ncbi:MAG: hypothetical protein DK306_001643 [Chloroflexi bacterium]|nr:MAG: hypothetical protein DK306_001643 [Chloroflexota bacterium]
MQWLLAAVAGAVIAVGGGMAGGFLERVEDPALLDESLLDAASAQAVHGDPAAAQADHGIPSAPGVGGEPAAGHEAPDQADQHDDPDAHDTATAAADTAGDGQAAEAPKSADYLSGYFDGQACALLDPDSGECLGAPEVVARLSGAYLEGWSAALRSLGVSPGATQATPVSVAPPRIVNLTRIQVEDLDSE